MKVILKEYIYKHGVAGDVVNVANGFARNYLIPRGLATKVTPAALEENERLIEQAKVNRKRLIAMESEAAANIDGVELVFGMKAGKNNKLYGSVTTRDIADAILEKTGVDIDRRRVSERPLRELGMHDVPVRISAQASPVIKVVILREEEVQPYLNGEEVPSLIDLGIQGEEEPVQEAAAVYDAAEAEAAEVVAAETEAEAEAEAEQEAAPVAEAETEVEVEAETETEQEAEAETEEADED